MINELQEDLAKLCRDLYKIEVKPSVEMSDGQFGDYASNVALQLAGRLGKNPRDIAQELSDKLNGGDYKKIHTAMPAGPGFINITLTQEALWTIVEAEPAKPLAGQTIVAEYSDPNPFKVLHAAHLYTSIMGDAVANLLENAGAKVHRVNFGGDVGLHVGKTMWAIVGHCSDGELNEGRALSEIQRLAEQELSARIAFITKRYVEGNNAYETDEKAKQQIIDYNKRVYQVHELDDHESPFAQIYWNCREWSYQYFDEFYRFIGSRFEKYYPESQTAPLGVKTVQEHIGDVYEESNGAIVFPGEKYGLHTRVFINSQGLPTYEAKDVGLIMAKWNDYKFDRSVVITGNDIIEYMKVVLKSIEQFAPDLSRRTTHVTHGIVKLSGGVKMSSRLGNILGATDVIQFAAAANRELTGKDDEQVTLGAVKYAFLKQRMGGDIIYDPAESVSIEGNSGPYLQYAHARAKSILSKADKQPAKSLDLDVPERSLLRKIGEYQEVVAKATEELMPHHVCTYLYELAQEFNSFYEKSRIIDDPREEVRLKLVELYSQTLKGGLNLLGIEAPERM
ncbi:MAG TPA: arginine--tRNA ligase [Candidatus Saccharimonadales bacterium]|nr:arginine--tRNA ligase [Candidatus Saccharimonadales bacterium]